MRKFLLLTAACIFSLAFTKAAVVDFDLTEYTITGDLTVSEATASSITFTGAGTITFTDVTNFSLYSQINYRHEQEEGGGVTYKMGDYSMTPYGSPNSDRVIPVALAQTKQDQNMTQNENTNFQVVVIDASRVVTISNFSGVEKLVMPEGYVSIYALTAEAERAPVSIDAETSRQLLGPGAGWGEDESYDMSDYEAFALKFTFDEADQGKQIAIRYAANGSVQSPVLVSFPAEGTTHIEEITLPEDAKMGAILVYNGAGHFSFSYTEEIPSNGITVEYVALKESVPTAPTALTIVPEDEAVAQALDVGETITLTVQFTPADAINQAVVWSSEDADIATVDENGVVTGVAAGSVNIIVTSEEDPSVSDSYEITVVDVTVPTLPAGYASLYTTLGLEERTPVSIAADESLQLLGPGANWDKDQSYDVSNYGAIALKFTFDEADQGKQIAIRYAVNGSVQSPVLANFPTEGTTHIEEILLPEDGAKMGAILVYNGAGHFSFSYTDETPDNEITVDFIALKEVEATGLTVVPLDEPLAQALPVGQTTTLKAQFIPNNTTIQTVEWSSEDADIATVDENGVVTGVAAGSVEITAVYQEDTSMSASYEVTVVADIISVTGVAFELETLSLKMLTNETLTYTVSPAIATNRNVSFASSDESIVTVDDAGKVTPVAAGSATITVETEDGEFTDECVVTVVGIDPIPEEWKSIYPHDYSYGGVIESKTELAPALVAVGEEKQLIGGAQGWGDAHVNHFDLTGYEKLAIKFSFNSADVGQKCGIRFSHAIAEDESTNGPVEITVPESLDYTLEIELEDYAFGDSDNIYIGGLIFYAKDHGAFDFEAGELITRDVVIDYVALYPEIKNALPTTLDNPDAIVNVFTITGVLVRKDVKQSEATIGLDKGLYIVGNKKVFVTK